LQKKLQEVDIFANNLPMSDTDFKYYIINKPYNVICQFTPDVEGQLALGNLYDLPKDVYPVGRLAQVEGKPKPTAIAKLEQGVSIKVEKKPYQTLPASINLLETEPTIPPRNPPIRVRQSIPTAWLSVTLIEGKNRQVRKMCAAIGYPCLRLIRISIEDLLLGDLGVGEIKEINREEIYTCLKINLN
jgi:23S rRNA pseudouridine2457 synthase